MMKTIKKLFTEKVSIFLAIMLCLSTVMLQTGCKKADTTEDYFSRYNATLTENSIDLNNEYSLEMLTDYKNNLEKLHNEVKENQNNIVKDNDYSEYNTLLYNIETELNEVNTKINSMQTNQNSEVTTVAETTLESTTATNNQSTNQQTKANNTKTNNAYANNNISTTKYTTKVTTKPTTKATTKATTTAKKEAKPKYGTTSFSNKNLTSSYYWHPLTITHIGLENGGIKTGMKGMHASNKELQKYALAAFPAPSNLAPGKSVSKTVWVYLGG